MDAAEHFVRHGYTVVRGAIPESHTQHVVESAWEELSREFGIDRNDPSSWQPTPENRRGHGYTRTRGTGQHTRLAQLAPRAFQAQADVIGGADRLPDDGQKLSWGDAVISNLGIEDDPRWKPPTDKQQPGWHKDGWHFRHFLNSPEQGLLIVPLYTDILPESGGTVIAKDAIAPVSRLLRDIPEGLHPDSVQGAGFIIPGLVDQCHDFTELTGQAGDVVLIHPYVLHRVTVNPTIRPRFIANMALVLSQPMSFIGNTKRPLSLVELAVLYALGESEYEVDNKRQFKAFKPSPFRDEQEREVESKALQQEMRELAERGFATPAWASDYGYMSNREHAMVN